MAYEVYQYNIPKVSEDGSESIPVPDSETQEFDSAEEAQSFAAEAREKFDRVVVVEGSEKPTRVERYIEGEKDESFVPEEENAEADA